MESSPLHEAQRALGAVFAEVSGWEIAAAFDSLDRECDAARSRVALLDRSSLGRLTARGADALDLLDRLSTNRVVDLPVGGGSSTVLATARGRIVDWLTVLRPDDALLIVTSPERRTAVAEWIDLYTFDEDASLEDITSETAMLGVVGPHAAAVVERVMGIAVADLPQLGCLTASLGDHRVTVARTDPAGQPGYDPVVPAAAATLLWDALLEAGAADGIAPIGEDAFEALRVAAGTPRWGRELTEERNPLEAGLEGAISWNKGCYTGQEVVSRLHTYHKVQRYLVGLALEGNGAATPGTPLTADGKSVGIVSSVALGSETGRAIALGYLQTPFVEVGRSVEVGPAGAGGGVATVVRTPELPTGPVPAALLDALNDDDKDEAE